ncbi:MAG: hypothetical protein ACRDRL_11415 [Sciscionella sp.]
MTDHPFGAWLDSDRTGPAPEPVPVPDAPDGQYWLSMDGEVIHLWCHLCTAGGDDYLGEWDTPPGYQYEGEVSAKVREHQAEQHTDTTESESRPVIDITSQGETAESIEAIKAGILALAEQSPDDKLNAAYRERAHLVALLTTLFPSHIGYTDPNEREWAVAIVETPAGQLSWHIARDDIYLFAHVPVSLSTDRGWDGHSTEEKYERVRKLIADKATAPLPTYPDQDRIEWAVRFTGPYFPISAISDYGTEEIARRIAAEDPEHRSVLHHRVIRRRDCFGKWIEDGPDTSALPTPWVDSAASPGQ